MFLNSWFSYFNFMVVCLAKVFLIYSDLAKTICVVHSSCIFSVVIWWNTGQLLETRYSFAWTMVMYHCWGNIFPLGWCKMGIMSSRSNETCGFVEESFQRSILASYMSFIVHFCMVAWTWGIASLTLLAWFLESATYFFLARWTFLWFFNCLL